MRRFVLKILLCPAFVLMPTAALAWGPMTHAYLGSEILFMGSLLPAAIYELIRRFREDFLYGNLMADYVLGKKYLPPERNAHGWEAALSLYDKANRNSEWAFSLGFLSHLAADTVAHDTYKEDFRDLNHALLEFRAEGAVSRRHWQSSVRIDRRVQRRNDRFLRDAAPRGSVILPFGATKKLYKGMVLLSGIGYQEAGGILDTLLGADSMVSPSQVGALHSECLQRIADVLTNTENSFVTNLNPNTPPRQSRLVAALYRP